MNIVKKNCVRFINVLLIIVSFFLKMFLMYILCVLYFLRWKAKDLTGNIVVLEYSYRVLSL